MVMTVARALATANQFKGFDVGCLVCDGAQEHRSHQLRAGTFKFGAFSQGDAEKSFAEFPVAFRHPVHGGPIFNMSDPPHILKKIANACWHSDLAGKQRALAMWCTDEHGNEKLVRFSLKTGERAYRLVENDGDSLSTEERVASISTFRNLKPGCFNRNSWNCMNVGMSSKVLSGTMVRIIDKVQFDRVTMGESPDLELECYAALASRVDAFIDIFNGK
ncbi:unnamed protein product [Pylaiella littoralis]